MNIQGNEVSYEQYHNTNDFVKQARKNAGGKISRIESIKQGKDALSDLVKLEGFPQGTVVQLIVATMSEQIAVSNPSALDDWRGWNYKPKYPVIDICKTSGKEKAAALLFKIGLKENIYLDFPNILHKNIMLKEVETEENIGDNPNIEATTWALKLKTLEGIETFKVVTYSDKSKGGIVINLNVNGDDFDSFVIAYEEMDAEHAGNLPLSVDNKHYNVWWKKNADTTLIYQNNKFYEKPKPCKAQFCTEAKPTFLGNVSDRLKQVRGGWLFKVSWQNEPLQAQNYQGFWVKYGEGDFNFLNINTPSAQEYNVVDSHGNIKGSLVQYYQHIVSIG